MNITKKPPESAIHHVNIVMLCFLLGLLGGCGPTLSKTPKDLRGDAWDAFRAVEGAKKLEQSNPKEAATIYERAIQNETKFGQPFQHYQTLLQGSAAAMQNGSAGTILPQEASLGFPDVYARHLLTAVCAHQGLARVHALQGRLSDAEKHATDALDIMTNRGHSPFFRAQSQVESYRILQEIYSNQRKVGRALLAKLNADLLGDHLASEGGTEDFFVEKALLHGEMAENQFGAVQQYVTGVNLHRLQQHNAQIIAATSALTAANASLQPNSAIARSQMQMMNIATSMAARAETKSLSLKGTPWVIPTFTQQLLDPKQGANTPTIMKGFASNAAEAGGASYQAGAQQVTQAVDELNPYRQSGNIDGAAAKIENFAEAFNAFLTQVQEIKK